MQRRQGVNEYVCLFKGKQIAVTAATSYQAQKLAADKFGIKPQAAHKIFVMIAKKDGEYIIHKPDF